MRYRIFIVNKKRSEKFSFVCSVYKLSEFFENFDDFFEDISDIIISFEKIDKEE